MKYLKICNAKSAPRYSFDHSKSMAAILVQQVRISRHAGTVSIGWRHVEQAV
jgi:hypothetical protein